MVTLDNDDKKWFKENFAIKDDILNLEKGQTKLEKGQANLENGLVSLGNRMSKLEKGQKKIQKDLKIVIKSFDTEYLGLKKRVVKIESHLEIQPSEF